MKHERLAALPPLFYNGLRESFSWGAELETGSSTSTECVALHIPKVYNEDAIFRIKLSYDSGWAIMQLLGLGDCGPPEGFHLDRSTSAL